MAGNSSIGTLFYPPKVDEISISSFCEMLRIFRNYLPESTRIISDQAATRNSVENLTHLLGLEISKPFYLNGRPGIRFARVPSQELSSLMELDSLIIFLLFASRGDAF